MRIRKSRARHTLPISLGILNTRDRSPEIGTTDRPPGLGNPHPGARLDSIDHIPGRLNTLPENIIPIPNIRRLEIRIPIRADKVTGANDRLVGRIHPRRPRIHMPNLQSRRADRCKLAADIVDLAGKGSGTGFLAVQVLAADRHRDDPVVAVLPDGSQQGLLLGLVVSPVLGPYTDEELGAGRQGSGDGGAERVAVGAGVEPGGGEVPGQRGHDLEVFGVVGGGFAGARREVGGDVDAFPVGVAGGEKGG